MTFQISGVSSVVPSSLLKGPVLSKQPPVGSLPEQPIQKEHWKGANVISRGEIGSNQQHFKQVITMKLHSQFEMCLGSVKDIYTSLA